MKDGSLIEEQYDHEADARETAETEHTRLDPDESISSHDTHDILDVSYTYNVFPSNCSIRMLMFKQEHKNYLYYSAAQSIKTGTRGGEREEEERRRRGKGRKLEDDRRDGGEVERRRRGNEARRREENEERGRLREERERARGEKVIRREEN